MTKPGRDATLEAVRRAVAAVPDPEVPVLTIEDLGVLQSVNWDGDHVVVTITPTYSGCPAMGHIEQEIGSALAASGVAGTVVTVLHPAWSSDWISDEGRHKLAEFGIAPPRTMTGRSLPGEGVPVELTRPVRCPRCGSTRTETISAFGSTACKALLRCLACLEPFDHFKEI